jgi:hypothetical protein
MARDGAGNYSRPVSDYVFDTVISETDVNLEMNQVATALTASIAKDGQTPTTAVIPFASGIQTDTVAEKTSANGVTVDSVLLKDGRADTAKGADIASATTTDISGATGNYLDVTGTTTITALGTAPAGAERTVQFDGALTLTHNATSLILPGGANITTAAGDVAVFVSEGSGNWRMTDYSVAALPPKKPAFLAEATGSQSNITSGSAIQFNTERFDVGGNYNNTTYTFTAPVTGLYQFNVSVRLSSVDIDYTVLAMSLETSNKTYQIDYIDPDHIGSADFTFMLKSSVLADMDAADTALVSVVFVGGANQMDVGNSASFFSGFLAA